MLVQHHSQRMARGTSSKAAGAAKLVLIFLALCFIARPVVAQTCTEDDFARAVDRAGAALREFNAENGPKVTVAVKALQQKRGWSDKELEEKAIEFLHTPRIARLDEKANELLSTIDMLGDVNEKSLDCSKLPELDSASRELLATMKEKSALTQTSLDAAIRTDSAASGTNVPAVTAKPKLEKQPHREQQAVPAHAQRPPAAPGSWDAATSHAPRVPGQDAAALGGEGRQIQQDALPAPLPESEPGYTLDEIRAATRGFFGTISTNLGSVIEYAFSNYGRPSAYVLGSEGGGAFLAGARYGKGTLFMRAGGERAVYWHGPSLGYDFGAEGSRTLFLIYQLKSETDLFRRFGGIDGSAYVLGGVGLTLLKGGPVLMAPIRTGVGLRLGANIGYVRFTPHATWNPF